MTRRNATNRRDVWQTPEHIVDMLGEIDVDPCAGANTTHGRINYTESDDGLSKEWEGRVFVNPPFSEKEEWLAEVIDQRDNTTVIFVLTPDSTDTQSWWHEYIAPFADYIWFSEGRTPFVDPATGERIGSPTFGTAISIFGAPGDETLERLAANGQLLRTYEP